MRPTEPSRLKGIETRISSATISGTDLPFTVLSRLKAIETNNPLNYVDSFPAPLSTPSRLKGMETFRLAGLQV